MTLSTIFKHRTESASEGEFYSDHNTIAFPDLSNNSLDPSKLTFASAVVGSESGSFLVYQITREEATL